MTLNDINVLNVTRNFTRSDYKIENIFKYKIKLDICITKYTYKVRVRAFTVKLKDWRDSDLI